MDRWRGKTAVVTGASAGIGASICVSIANAGVNVIGLARRPQLIDELKSQIQGDGSIVSRKCDVASAEDVADAFRWIDDTVGGIHILVNNAGIFNKGCITAASDSVLSEQDILSTIDVNFKGTVICARHAVASMKKHSIDGHVINVNSIAGHYIPFSSIFNVYPATKYAISAFTKALLEEFADYNCNIKVTSLSPGLVDTDLAVNPSTTNIPALQPSDVAAAVMYVLSTPPHMNIEELTISPLKGKRM